MVTRLVIKNYKIYNSNNCSLKDSEVSDDLHCNVEVGINGNSAHLKSIKLSELIFLLNRISDTSIIYGDDKYSFELIGENNYLFKWSRENVNSTNHIISMSSNETELINETIWTGTFSSFKELFFLQLIAELIDLELVDFAHKYGELFFNYNPNTGFKYKIGERVKTILNENVKTEREGYIIDKWYHGNEKSNIYHLMIDGRKYKKRYFERDFELINPLL